MKSGVEFPTWSTELVLKKFLILSISDAVVLQKHYKDILRQT